MIVTKQQLVQELKKLGVERGDILNVKVSMKSIGRVEDGPNGLINALMEAVGPEGTIVTDSFMTAYPLPLSKQHAHKVSRQSSASYAGALANAMISYPGASRSPHPIQKFVSVGKRAKEITQKHTMDKMAYALLNDIASLGAKNLKIGRDEKVPGVGTTHVAIETLGVKRKRPRTGTMYETKHGSIELYEVNWAGGCEAAWLKFYPEYERIGAVLGSGFIGQGPAKLTSMQKTLEWEINTIKADSKVLLCGRSDCRTCQVEWEFSEGSALLCAIRRLPSTAKRYLSSLNRRFFRKP